MDPDKWDSVGDAQIYLIIQVELFRSYKKKY